MTFLVAGMVAVREFEGSRFSGCAQLGARAWSGYSWSGSLVRRAGQALENIREKG